MHEGVDMKCHFCGKSIKNNEKYYRLFECKGWIEKHGWEDPDQGSEMALVCSGDCLAKCAALIARDARAHFR